MNNRERIEALSSDLSFLAEVAPHDFNQVATAIEAAKHVASVSLQSTAATLSNEERKMGEGFPGGVDGYARAKGIATGRLARLLPADKERLAVMSGGSWNWSGMAAAAEREGLFV